MPKGPKDLTEWAGGYWIPATTKVARSPSALLPILLWGEGSPTKIDYRKKTTFLLAFKEWLPALQGNGVTGLANLAVRIVDNHCKGSH